MNRFKISIFLIIGLLASCKDETSNTPIVSKELKLTLQFQTFVQNKEVKLNTYYPMSNGDSILVGRLDYYVDEIKIMNNAGASSSHLNNILLYSLESNENALKLVSKEFPPSISKIEMLVGLDSISNKSNPTIYDPAHPLSTYKNMWWTMSTNYRYIIFEGRFKTSSNNVFNFSYHTGLRFKYTTALNKSISLVADQDNIQVVKLDLDKVVLPGQDKNILYQLGEIQAHGDALDAVLTDKVAANFSKAFSIQ